MAQDFATAFGQYLRLLRMRRGLSLGEVEALSSPLFERVDRGNLSRWENGKQVIGVSKLIPISRIYNVPVEAIVERMELDLQVQQDGAPGTDDLDCETLNRLGTDALDKEGRALWAYAYQRDRLGQCVAHDADSDMISVATMSCATAAQRVGFLRYALHEFAHVEATGGQSDEIRVWALNRLSSTYSVMMQPDRALRLAQRAIAEAERLGCHSLAVATYSTLARSSIDTSPEDAVAYAQKALAVRHETRKRPGSRVFISDGMVRPRVLMMCGESYLKMRRLGGARRALKAAATLSERRNLPREVAASEILIGDLNLLEGCSRSAVRRWRSGESMARALGDQALALRAASRLFRREVEADRFASARAMARRLRRVAMSLSTGAEAIAEFHEIERRYAERLDAAKSVANRVVS